MNNKKFEPLKPGSLYRFKNPENCTDFFIYDPKRFHWAEAIIISYPEDTIYMFLEIRVVTEKNNCIVSPKKLIHMFLGPDGKIIWNSFGTPVESRLVEIIE